MCHLSGKGYRKHTRKVYPLLMLSMVQIALPPYVTCGKYNLNSNENMKHVKDCVLNPNNFSNVHNLQIAPGMVQKAIDTLKCGKSCGNDGLSAEHFKHADGCVPILLSIIYTGAIRHGDFMKTISIHLVKNKAGDLNDVNNYRPIALVTVVSNFFETILLELMEPYLSTTDNQFGFKKGHSSDHCIYVLKMLYNITETILVFYMLLKLSTGLTTGHFLRNV